MRPTVHITRNLPEVAAELLTAAGVEVRVNTSDTPLSPEQLQTVAAEADGLLCFLHDKITADLIAAAPRCRVYANFAVGYDNFDVAASTRAGVALCNTPDVLTIATAEFAWALLMAAARRVGEGERMVRRGEFHGWGPLMLLGQEMTGKTLGIVGAGRIGAATAKLSRGFDMKILYTKRSGTRPGLEALGGQRVALDELLAQSDFVSIHTPLTPETRHLIGARELQMMKPTAVLVNTARGPVVNEGAPAQALQSGTIAAAGLDVYEREPEVHPALLNLDNVVLAPHLGSATHETRDGMAQLAAQNLIDFFQGRTPRSCINPESVH